MPIYLQDRLDRKFYLKIKNGDRIYNVLCKNHIPIDAVMVRKNGVIIDDYFEVYDERYNYVIEMVRAYHLPDFLTYLNLWDYDVNTYIPEEYSYYTKRFANHDEENGDFNYCLTKFDQNEFVRYIENMFVDGCNEAELLSENEAVLLALSGGRDSLSLGYFLSRNKNRLPNIKLSAIHVETSSNKLETSYAIAIADNFDFPIHIYSDMDVTNLYNLKVSIHEALLKIKNDFNRSYSIFSAHNIIKACVENHARKIGVSTIMYGLMNEDVAASIIKGAFIGMPFRGPLARTYGKFKLIYPLWSITKKELTLYLEVINKNHNLQGSPSIYERGALSRDIYYFIVDTLETICPGITYQIIEASKISTQNSLLPVNYLNCRNCGTTYTSDYSVQSDDLFEREEGLCDLCNMFNKFNLIK